MSAVSAGAHWVDVRADPSPAGSVGGRAGYEASSSTQTTDIYLQADPTEKLEALAAMKPPMLRPGKFLPPDRLIAALRAPAVMRTSKATNP